MEFEKVEYLVENNVANIVLNSPVNLNALDESMLDELLQVLDQSEKDESVKVIVISGAGRGFSAGGDIGAMFMGIMSGDMDFGDSIKKAGQVSLKIKRLPKPVIASVHGAVAGAGANLALACDFCIAAENAKFIEAFVNLGLIPDAGGVYLLTRAIGVNKTSELIMTGRPVTAEEAAKLGFVNQVVPVENLAEATQKYAAKLVAAPSLAIAKMKTLIFESEYKDFEKYLELEDTCQKQCGASEDFKEGVFSFVEKRRPKFTGK